MRDEGERNAPPCAGPRGNLLDIGVGLGILAALTAILIPNFVRTSCGGTLTACKSNLKNIGTALEMYSTDFAGKYPGSLEPLIPNYLKTLPECPSARYNTYRATLGLKAPFNTEASEDYYLVECMGTAHEDVSVPPDYPKYNAIRGLIER